MMITMNIKRGFNFLSGPRERLGSLLRLQGNKVCADCGSPSPKWVSLSIGVFICIRCSSVHRSLGTHITKVMSVKLDDWTDEQVDKMEKAGGNVVVNQRYDSYLPDNVKKLKPDSSPDERVDYIKKKYEMLQFPITSSVNDSTASVSLATLLKQESKKCEKLRSGNRPSSNCSYGIGSAFRHSGRKKEMDHNKSKKNSTSGMIEFVGLIKVNILRGLNLAIRDVISSDPYVVLTLGHQSMKTRVIKSNLNPIWNEKLMLSIPDTIPNLRVQVFDKDLFSADDHMGEAEIDIHPLLTVAKAYENSSISESTQLGKCLASEDNTLVRDSLISLVDGRILQELCLKLKNVECGELDIELECVPLTQ